MAAKSETIEVQEKSSDSPTEAAETPTGGPASNSCSLNPEAIFPQTKVKALMKKFPGGFSEHAGNDVVYLVTKATELFVDYITTEAKNQPHDGLVLHKQLAEVVTQQQQSKMKFLKDVIPAKMTARDALKQMAEQKAQEKEDLLLDLQI